MIKYIFRKIQNKKWMSLCLLLGITLLVAVCSCHAIFLAGATDKIIDDRFEEFIDNNNTYSAVLSRQGNVAKSGYTSIEAIRNEYKQYAEQYLQYIDIPVIDNQFTINSGTATSFYYNFAMYYVDNLKDHITMVDGVFYDEANVTGIPVIIDEETVDEKGLRVGDVLECTKLFDANNNPIVFEIVGVFKKASDEDLFWNDDLEDMYGAIYMSEPNIEKTIECQKMPSIAVRYHTMLDYTKINYSNIYDYYDYLIDIGKQDIFFSTDMIEIIRNCKSDIRQVSMLLYVMEIPVLGLLVLFIFMVSNTLITKEEGEIAAIRSRGIGRGKVIKSYLLQNFIMSVFAAVLGLFVGLLLCRIAASSEAFLVFKHKDVSVYKIVPMSLVGALIGILISTVCMIIPVIAKSGTTIVEQKSKMGTSAKKPFWEKWFFDVILVGVAGYLLYNYTKQKEVLATSIINKEMSDPIVFLSASIMILALGLIAIRLVGYLISFIDKIFKNHFKAITFASMLQIKRSYRAQSFIVIFIIFTLAEGVYNANLARSINTANNDRLIYNFGTDVRFSERFRLNKIKDQNDGITYYYFTEPDSSKYNALVNDGSIESFTKVIFEKKVLAYVNGATVSNCTLMGIHTREFGNTAFLEKDLNKEHWFNALNALAADPAGVIVNEAFAEKNALKVGSSFQVARPEKSGGEGNEMPTVVFVSAIVKTFPGFEEYEYVEGADGKIQKVQRSLMVVNYAQAVNNYGVSPYEIWIRLKDSKDDTKVKELLESTNSVVEKYETLANLQKEQNDDLMTQITNGMFSINFIISSIICVIGYLLYWIMTIKNRELLFGVYRAMGVTEREIRKMLLIEQSFCSLLAAVFGIGIGFAVTKLFVKLIAIAYIPKDHVLPVEIMTDLSDMKIIVGFVAIMIIICFIVMLRIIKSMKISSALKLGEE